MLRNSLKCRNIANNVHYRDPLSLVARYHGINAFSTTARRSAATIAASVGKSGNAAHNAQVAAKSERQRQIIKLVEKKMQLRKSLVDSHNLSVDLDQNEEAVTAGSQTYADKIKASKLIKELEPLVQPWEEWQTAEASLSQTTELLKDPDPSLRSLAEDEAEELRNKMNSLVDDIFPPLLIPESSTVEMGALVEIKAGAGGEEACLFAADLLRMYTRYADIWGADIASRGNDGGHLPWRTSIVSESSASSIGGKPGYKEVILEIKGRGAYDTYKWETGVHRVQRVPETETSGRLHTSAVAVVVLPLTENNTGDRNVADFEVDEKEVKVEVMRARGAGGQHVNKTESAVRLTHVPTGITVSMQDSRSQHTNKQYAWKILKSRLFDLKLRQEAERSRDTRRSLIKGMDRSDKIRTYNYVQDRVTDHRTGFTTMNLDDVMDGEGLERVIDACRKRNEEETMASLIED
ncbi:release factor [Serendipita vermifera]|nr:release factor [Serendipita vermifera]